MKPLRFTATATLVAALTGPAFGQTDTANAPLTPADQSKACAQNWTFVDSDRSGAVSEAESKAVADSGFARIDVDADGSLSLSEWEACGDPNASSGGTSGSVQINELPPWNADDFASFDSDKSGDVSAEEASEASRTNASDVGEETARRAGAMFARVDANGDGRMSAEEWDNRNSQTFNGLFARVDADGNGAISTDEWRSYRDRGYRSAAEGAGPAPTIWRYYYFVVG